MEAHYAGLTFLASGRVSKRRVIYALMRLAVRFTLFVSAALHALAAGTVNALTLFTEAMSDHFNNRKYPKDLR